MLSIQIMCMQVVCFHHLPSSEIGINNSVFHCCMQWVRLFYGKESVLLYSKEQWKLHNAQQGNPPTDQYEGTAEEEEGRKFYLDNQS